MREQAWGRCDDVVDPGDGSLIRLAAQRDEDAWALILDRHWHTAYRVARSLVDRHEDAEDVAQEALLVSLRQLDGGTAPRHFHAWFLRIVWTRALNYLRRESLRRMEPLPRDAACEGTPCPEVAAERSEFWRALGEGLQELPDERRRAFLMHDVEGRKHREIAESLGLRSGTARSHVSLARKALRASLAAYHTP